LLFVGYNSLADFSDIDGGLPAVSNTGQYRRASGSAAGPATVNEQPSKPTSIADSQQMGVLIIILLTSIATLTRTKVIC